MKTILDTLITTLISMIQCGWGIETVTLNSWDDIVDNSDQEGDRYTLNTGKNYMVKKTMTFPNNLILVIPEDVTFQSDKVDIKLLSNIENYGTFLNNKMYAAGTRAIINNYSNFQNKDTSLRVESAAASLIINNMANATFTNDAPLYASFGKITFNVKGGTVINNKSMYISNSGEMTFDGKPGETVTDNGGGKITNRGNIYVVKGCINFENIEVYTAGTQKTPAGIYFTAPDSSSSTTTISSGSTLSFGDYAKFYGKDVIANTTLNGKLEFTSLSSYFYKVNISSGSGIIDMQAIRPFPKESQESWDLNVLKTTQDLIDNIQDVTTGESSNIKVYLPFNCKFKNVDLSNAGSISYTFLDVKEVGIDTESNVIKKIGNTYGDYASMIADQNTEADVPGLGVKLTRGDDGKVDTDVVHADKRSAEETMLLSELVLAKGEDNKLKYNKNIYKLWTNDLDDAMHEISGNTTYCFGFIGTTPIQISGDGKAIFMGDNRGYTLKDEDDNPVGITLPNNVEFGANNSLFPFSYTYVKGTFSAAEEGKTISNTIPADKTIEFTDGFTLGAGHTLTVNGTLIG